ncbi:MULTISPECIES: AAA family ATPase [unclassified Burkholderia]|uniref:AAA family ATPase n=1 Tax=unclassified Burkholderia TaxID=2613784 RepID=UPI002AB2FD4C|nr:MULTISPECIES: AAA family ATPase [unclassified Burkholderia]
MTQHQSLPFSSVGAGGSVARKPISLNPEQQQVLDADASRMVVQGGPGTGKTLLAARFAARYPDRNVIMLVRDDRARIDLESRLRDAGVVQAQVHTFDSYAIEQIRLRRPDLLGADVVPEWQPYFLVHRQAKSHQADLIADHAFDLLNGFFATQDDVPDVKHFTPDMLFNFAAKGAPGANLMNEIVAEAREVWDLIRAGKIPVPKVAAVKVFHQVVFSADPVARWSPHDILIIDDAQHLNGAMLKFVQSLVTHCEPYALLILGDAYQRVDYFHDSLHPMDALSAGVPLFRLTQSYRVSPMVAGVAQAILSHLIRAPEHLVGTHLEDVDLGANMARADTSGQEAFVARTISPLLGLVLKEADAHPDSFAHRLCWRDVGEALRILMSVYALANNRRGDVILPFYRQFSDYATLISFAHATADISILGMAQLIEQYGSKLPSLVDRIVENRVALRTPRRADDGGAPRLTLATVNEIGDAAFDTVRLANDFTVCKDVQDPRGVVGDGAVNRDVASDVREARLLYLAVTRARREVHLNDETLAWYRGIPGVTLGAGLLDTRTDTLDQSTSAATAAAPGAATSSSPAALPLPFTRR